MKKDVFLSKCVELAIDEETATEVYAKFSKTADKVLKSIADADDPIAFADALLEEPETEVTVVNAGLNGAKAAPIDIVSGRISSVVFQGAYMKDADRNLTEDGNLPESSTDWTRSHFRIGVRDTKGVLRYVIAGYRLLNRECAAIVAQAGAKTGVERVNALIAGLKDQFVAVEVQMFSKDTWYLVPKDASHPESAEPKFFMDAVNHLKSLTIDGNDGTIAALYNDWVSGNTRNQAAESVAKHLSAVVSASKATFTGSDIVALLAQMR